MKKQWFDSATSCAYRNIVVVSFVVLACMSCQRDARATDGARISLRNGTVTGYC